MNTITPLLSPQHKEDDAPKENDTKYSYNKTN